MKPVVRQKWWETEYEPDWGRSDRPDGESFHLTEADRAAYCAERAEEEKRNAAKTFEKAKTTPALVGYSCISEPTGGATIVDVDDELYEKIKATKNGLYFSQQEVRSQKTA